jgi:hypothetical protein
MESCLWGVDGGEGRTPLCKGCLGGGGAKMRVFAFLRVLLVIFVGQLLVLSV